MGLGEGEMMMGLDLKLCTMKSVNGFLKEARGEGGDARATKMEEFVKLLEEEKAKIEVFKRELPLCMHLIGDVIEGLKREVEKCRVGTKKSRLEEEEEETDRRDKMSWMSSAQLWSDNNNANANINNISEKKMSQEEKRKSASVEISVNGAGAFTPFKGATAAPLAAKKEEAAAIAAVGLPDLSLLSPAMRSPPPAIAGAGDGGRARVVGRGPVAASVAAAGPHLSLQPQPQPQGTPSSASASAAAAAAAAAARKARRCWSPELHRRFVMALEHLGGAQVATPKQIRELMKVDGLTNDEVKSHLQKYRLHTRRIPNTAPPNVSPQVVAMGGLWMHQQQQQQQQQQQDQDTASQQSTSQSGSPQGPLQFNSHGRALSMTTTTNGDSCEEEDGRSESYSWK